MEDIISKVSISDLSKDITNFEEHMKILEPICCKDKFNQELFDNIRDVHYITNYEDFKIHISPLAKPNKVRLMVNVDLPMYELE